AYMAQSGAFVKQANAFVAQAQIAARTGQILQANEMVRASQAEKEAEEQSRRAAELRRQLIGGAKTQFAANGVLLESRPQSAVAMWEQDETADLAFELMGIKEKRDNEVWGYVWNGNQARLQGLFDAQALKLQGDASMIEAGNARINASSAMAQSRIALLEAQMAGTNWLGVRAAGNANVDAARWNMYSSIGGSAATIGTVAYSRSASPTARTGSAYQPNNDASARFANSPLNA
ncbi:MAG TPA: hypothetical protein P5204_08385, partial [Kiritimatiellia bacterium]|nr:hypothetical protein [Kiritimatiellia bacterium]